MLAGNLGELATVVGTGWARSGGGAPTMVAAGGREGKEMVATMELQ